MTPDRINSYGMIGDMRSGALVGADGTIEWMCLPRFDAAAQFASLLGTHENGRWTLAPAGGVLTSVRRYEPATLVLETIYTTDGGSARVLDFMPVDTAAPAVVRVIEGITGRVTFQTKITPRMKYGSLAPITKFVDGDWLAIAAPDGLCVRSTTQLGEEFHGAGGAISVEAGERAGITLQWFSAFASVPERIDPFAELDATRAWWLEWTSDFDYDGSYRDLMLRSAITLKSLQSREHGSFVAALTTSLPEKRGEANNWDYRYAWLRDCSFSVESLLGVGFRAEAEAWRSWFIKTYAGCTPHLKIMYAVDGSLVNDETEIPWLSGFENSTPVRVGNNAHSQFQLGVYGNVMTSFEHAQKAGLVFEEEAWSFVTPMLEFMEENWHRSDSGLWEERENSRQFVDSKLMVWVALDRALIMAKRGNLPIETERWTKFRDRVHDEICRAGFDPVRNTFTQSYGSHELDAANLLLVILGFLPPDDPRMIGTVDAIANALYDDGYVYRYTTDELDGIRKEGSFIICGFWLVKAYAMIGRREEAETLFVRLVETANDLGLFAEEYASLKTIALGNFPQAFSHAGFIEAAYELYGPK